MKRVLIELLAVVVLSSCGGKKMRDPFAVMAQLPEPDVPVADSLFAKEVLKPLEADELFDDFIFNLPWTKLCRSSVRGSRCLILTAIR